jgi:transcriptional regulator with XRE-family HTH domain
MATRLGVKIRRLRERLNDRRGISQEELANKVGVTQQYVALLEKGERKPSLDTLRKLAKALDVAVGELVE